MTDDEENRLPGADELEPLADESEPLIVERGAALDTDEDAIREAAETSLDMEGFETGAGFDLDDLPDGGTQHLDIEAMEVRSSSFDELDAKEAEASSPAELSVEDPVADRSPGGSDDADRSAADRAVTPHPDLRISDHDEASLLLPTPDDDTRAEARHRGLEALERRRKRRARGMWLMIVSTFLLVGGGAFAVVYLGVIEIPGITFPEWSRSAVSAPAALPGPQSDAPVMSHVILVDTWREAETPGAWADALRERMPDLLGLVTPLSIDGDEQYALLVGPAYNAAEADELKAPLALAFDLLNPDPESWAVQEAPYSFFFGEYETLGEATARVQALADLSIPAFVLRVTYPDQAGALRVYGGAFSDETQAGGMGRLLNDNDLGDAPFTELRGRLPD